MENLSLIVSIATAAITAAVVLLNVLAPITKTDKDDKILAFLRWVQEALTKIILPTAGVRANKLK